LHCPFSTCRTGSVHGSLVSTEQHIFSHLSSQLLRAHADINELLADREGSFRRDDYIESMVEQAHKDTLRERAVFVAQLQAAKIEIEKMQKLLDDERSKYTKVNLPQWNMFFDSFDETHCQSVMINC